MRERILIAALVSVLALETASLGWQKSPDVAIDVPYGREPKLDGKFDEGEWDDAVVNESGSTKVRFKHGDAHLFVAVNSDQPIWGSLLVRTKAAIFVLHASAAPGEIRYEPDGEGKQWSRKSMWDFEGFHAKVQKLKAGGKSDGEALKKALAEFEKQAGWSACLMREQAKEFATEFRISYEKLAIDPKDGGAAAEIRCLAIGTSVWPATATEDQQILNGLHLGSAVKDSIAFSPENWGRLTSKSGWKKPKTQKKP